MKLWEAIRQAVGALRANRLRSALTILGTVVGVLAVVSIVAITQGLNRYVARELLATGSHVFSISQFGLITDQESWYQALKRRPLRSEDADYLRERLHGCDVVVPSVGTQRDVSWRGRTAKGVHVAGFGADYEALDDSFVLQGGRALGTEDVRGAHLTAVLGSEVAEQLFAGADPLGQRVRIGRDTFWVAGVLQRRGKVLGVSRDNLVVIPITTFQKLFERRQSVEILVKAASPESYAPCQEEAALLLKLRRGLKPWDEPDFGLETSETLYALYSRATSAVFLGMVAVVGLSVIVGGIVMMNIMLVAVSERTREIGIAKAVGARRHDVLLQFLVEAATLAALGGVIGVLLGAGVAWVVRAASSLPTRVEPWSVIASLGLALVVGVLSGLYPAHRAARLSPIHALRYEK